MFGTRKRHFPFNEHEDGNKVKAAKCMCPVSRTTSIQDHYTDSEVRGQTRQESHQYQDMEIDCSSIGCNNNEQVENRNVLPKQQTCRQCLAGQGGHFMHISTDSNNNT